MAIGTTLLLIAAALIFFGAAQRLLDRLRLTDSQALVLIALMIGGSFITIPPDTWFHQHKCQSGRCSSAPWHNCLSPTYSRHQY